jgi:hypothetical protein
MEVARKPTRWFWDVQLAPCRPRKCTARQCTIQGTWRRNVVQEHGFRGSQLARGLAGNDKSKTTAIAVVCGYLPLAPRDEELRILRGEQEVDEANLHFDDDDDDDEDEDDLSGGDGEEDDDDMDDIGAARRGGGGGGGGGGGRQQGRQVS